MAKCEREKEGTTLSATLVGQMLDFIKKVHNKAFNIHY